MEFPNGKGNLRLLVWVVVVADSQTRSKPNWRQSCDKSTVKLLTTVAFCDMSTVDISTVYIYTSPHHPLQVCANNNQYYEGEDDAGMMSEAETSSSRTRRGGLPGREVGKVLSESS